MIAQDSNGETHPPPLVALFIEENEDLVKKKDMILIRKRTLMAFASRVIQEVFHRVRCSNLCMR